jgi:hypothetical protein
MMVTTHAFLKQTSSYIFTQFNIQKYRLVDLLWFVSLQEAYDHPIAYHENAQIQILKENKKAFFCGCFDQPQE